MTITKELCGFGCGRPWDAEGDEDGFEDCVSSYHQKKKKSPTIQIPRAWLERLIALSDAILTSSQVIMEKRKQQLHGYIESAKALLNQDK